MEIVKLQKILLKWLLFNRFWVQ